MSLGEGTSPKVLAWFQISTSKRCVCPAGRELGCAVDSLCLGQGSSICFFLLGMRGEVWFEMKCSEAHCDCTAKARPPVSQLSSTKTQCRCSAVKETLIALLRWQKAKWENWLRLHLTRATFPCITNIRKTPLKL